MTARALHHRQLALLRQALELCAEVSDAIFGLLVLAEVGEGDNQNVAAHPGVTPLTSEVHIRCGFGQQSLTATACRACGRHRAVSRLSASTSGPARARKCNSSTAFVADLAPQDQLGTGRLWSTPGANLANS